MPKLRLHPARAQLRGYDVMPHTCENKEEIVSNKTHTWLNLFSTRPTGRRGLWKVNSPSLSVNSFFSAHTRKCREKQPLLEYTKCDHKVSGLCTSIGSVERWKIESCLNSNKNPFGHWLSYTNKCTVVYCTRLKFTLKTCKSSYMFRSSDHLQGAYIVPS
jgi:hypothetical protein